MSRFRLTRMAAGALTVALTVTPGPAGAAQAEGRTSIVDLPAGVTAQRVAADPDGAIWFTDPDSHRIGRRTATGAVDLFPLAAGHRPADLAWGSDGDMWFTTQAGVGRVDPATTAVVEIPVPGGGTDLAMADDGAAWVTQGSSVARVTAGGDVDRFPTPDPDWSPAGIAAGADGLMWVTNSNGGTVATISQTGSFTEYPVGPAAQYGIVVGADKAMWFATADNTIDRIDPDGTWTRLQQAGVGPEILTSAPDGNVWFTQSGSGVGVISPLGSVRLVPADAATTGVTADPYGAVWAAAGARLIRITTAVDPAVRPPAVSGNGHVGARLMCLAPSWAYLPRTLTVQWFLDGQLMAGQNKVSYTPTSDLVGRSITCRAIATFSGLAVPVIAPARNSVTVLPQQSQSVALPGRITVDKPKRLQRYTRQEQPVTYRVLTPNRCRIQRGPLRLTGRKAGACKVAASAPGSARFTVLTITKSVTVKKITKRR